eukprot:g3538.t1
MAEIDPAYWGAKTSQDQSVSRTPTGKLKMIHFLDVDVLHWQRVLHLSLLRGGSRTDEQTNKQISPALSIKKERWLIIVCENKILFYDLASHNSRELSKTALDSKNPVCVSILPNNPKSEDLDDVLIAIGCTDGTIRLVYFSTLKTVVKLGYKSSAVTTLMSVHVSPVSTLIVSGSQEGSVYLWDPFPAVAGSSTTSLPPVSTSAKAHDGEVVSLSIGHWSLESPTLAVFSLGADRSVVIYEVPGLRPLSRFKGPNQRLPFHSIDVAQPLEVSQERCPVLLAGQGFIWGSTLNGSNFHKLIDPAVLFPSVAKKAVKIYYISLHPLHKHWLLIGTNTGAALVHLSVPFLSPTVSLPIPQTPTQSFEITCLKTSRNALSQVKYMAVSQDSSLPSVPELVFESEIANFSNKLASNGHRQFILSPCTTKLAVVQTDTNQFMIYMNTNGDTWTEMMEGKGSYLVWSTSSEFVAVLDVPPPSPTASSSSRMLMRMRSKVDSSHSHTSETAPPPPASLRLYKLGDLTPVDLTLETRSAVLLHGGPMLGITCSTWSGNANQSFLFYSWEHHQQCSDELPAPNWLAWNDTNDLCVMTYSSHILLCQATDRFKMLNSLPIVGGISGMWKDDLFFIATHNTIESVILQRSTDPLDRDQIISIQTVVLAGFEFGVNWLTGKSEELGRAQKARPIGHLKILNVTSDKIWLVDTHDQISILDLTFPGFLALSHCSRHDYSAARVSAMGKLPSDFLGEMFLRSGQKASIEALKLPGLSLPLRLKIAITGQYLKHALICFQAILAGCLRAEAVVRLPEFRETLKDESSTPKKALTSSTVSPFAQIADQSNQIDLQSAFSGDSIDWELPLKSIEKKTKIKSKKEVSREVLELGLALYDASIKERLYSVAEKVASLIIEYCDESTDSEILLELECKLAERGYTEKLKSLATLSEKSKTSSQGQIKSLAAAVLAGDPLTITQVLQDLRMS